MKQSLKESLKGRISETAKDGVDFVTVKQTVLDLAKTKRTVRFYQAKSGKEKLNRLDIIPFEISEDWYASLKGHSNRPTGRQPGDLDYKLEVPVHSFKDLPPILCLNFAFRKRCSVCEEWTKQKQAGNEDEARVLQPKWRVFYNIVDRTKKNHFEKGIVQVWEHSFHLFEKYLKEEVDSGRDGTVPFAALDSDGRTLEFKGIEKKIGKTGVYIECPEITFLKRKLEYSDNILKKAFRLDRLLNVPTPEDVEKLFYGFSKNNEEKKGGKKSKRFNEEEELEDDDEEGDEEDNE